MGAAESSGCHLQALECGQPRGQAAAQVGEGHVQGHHISVGDAWQCVAQRGQQAAGHAWPPAVWGGVCGWGLGRAFCLLEAGALHGSRAGQQDAQHPTPDWRPTHMQYDSDWFHAWLLRQVLPPVLLCSSSRADRCAGMSSAVPANKVDKGVSCGVPVEWAAWACAMTATTSNVLQAFSATRERLWGCIGPARDQAGLPGCRIQSHTRVASRQAWLQANRAPPARRSPLPPRGQRSAVSPKTGSRADFRVGQLAAAARWHSWRQSRPQRRPPARGRAPPTPTTASCTPLPADACSACRRAVRHEQASADNLIDSKAMAPRVHIAVCRQAAGQLNPQPATRARWGAQPACKPMPRAALPSDQLWQGPLQVT
jgi:hypothetical protein